MYLKELKKIGIRNIKFFAKGKRSHIYIGIYKNKKVTIKIKNPNSLAINRIKNEAKYLRILNKCDIGPKLISYNKNYIIYNFVEGELFIDYIKHNKNNFKIIKNILEQCRTLDKLKINKLEFTRPIKHVFIKNKKVTIIDFERCYQTNNPKNVTQFCQFLITNFNIDKKEFSKILKGYKKQQSNINFNKIIKYLKSIFF